jgi:hypothetical protein
MRNIKIDQATTVAIRLDSLIGWFLLKQLYLFTFYSVFHSIVPVPTEIMDQLNNTSL